MFSNFSILKLLIWLYWTKAILLILAVIASAFKRLPKKPKGANQK